MTINSRAGLLGFLVSLAAFTQPGGATVSRPGADATIPIAPTSIEGRLSRIAAAARERQAQLGVAAGPLALPGTPVAAFVNGPRGGAVARPAGGFVNGHPYYGGASRGFVNGGGGFVNAAYGGGGFVNARPGGGAFRNW